VTEYLHKFTELSCYAPYEVDNDEKKHYAFLRGLDLELRTLIGAGVYPDFNTMVNRAITIARTSRMRRETERGNLKPRGHIPRRRP
jgi:hypothetical protein